MTINTDKAATYGLAIAALKKEGRLSKDVQHQQVQYLNNLLEADHGKLKRLTARRSGLHHAAPPGAARHRA